MEPWKRPCYTRQNTWFVVDLRGELEARIIHPVVVVDTIFEPWEKEGYQPKVLDNECFLDKCGDHFDIL